ncbi:OmpA family protein [Millisia brevis]|uniref:OmpA family protein n=1 Tax=Millisia brevis TaxID=264148 RepID=UPI001C3F3574|nr:OmpA family protein [Millisia brevis]
MRNEEVEAIPERARHLVDARLADLTATLSRLTAGTSELDLLTVLDRGVRRTPPGGTVMVLSSGIQTVDPLNLSTLGWSFDPRQAAIDLAERGLIPDAAGRHVSMSGIGTALGTQPALPRPQRQLLIELWREVCAASGAESCEISDQEVTLTVPLATLPVSVVAVPHLSTEEPSCRSGLIRIPDSVLFQPDTARLLPSADASLSALARQFTACSPGVAIRIVGHSADVDPDRIDGEDLSEQRAYMARNRLVELGVPDRYFAEIRGAADTERRVDNHVDGQFDEALAAMNRRVEISVEVK